MQRENGRDPEKMIIKYASLLTKESLQKRRQRLREIRVIVMIMMIMTIMTTSGGEGEGRGVLESNYTFSKVNVVYSVQKRYSNSGLGHY
jgi:hypothetical protein